MHLNLLLSVSLLALAPLADARLHRPIRPSDPEGHGRCMAAYKNIITDDDERDRGCRIVPNEKLKPDYVRCVKVHAGLKSDRPMQQCDSAEKRAAVEDAGYRDCVRDRVAQGKTITHLYCHKIQDRSKDASAAESNAAPSAPRRNSGGLCEQRALHLRDCSPHECPYIMGVVMEIKGMEDGNCHEVQKSAKDGRPLMDCRYPTSVLRELAMRVARGTKDMRVSGKLHMTTGDSAGTDADFIQRVTREHCKACSPDGTCDKSIGG